MGVVKDKGRVLGVVVEKTDGCQLGLGGRGENGGGQGCGEVGVHSAGGQSALYLAKCCGGRLLRAAWMGQSAPAGRGTGVVEGRPQGLDGDPSVGVPV